MSLKILYSHVAMIDYPRGLFFRSFGFARELVKRGHDVTFLATQYRGFSFPWRIENREGVKIVSFPSIMPIKVRWLGYAPLTLCMRIIYLLNKKYDIYHCDHHRPTSFFPALVGKFLNGGKVLVEWMDYMGRGSQYDRKSIAWKMTIGMFDNYLELKSNTVADGVIVISEYLRQQAINSGVNKKYIVKIWGASDTQKIDFVENKYQLKKKHKLPADTFMVNLANMSLYEIEHYYDYIYGFLNRLRKNRLVTVIKTGSESDKLNSLAKKLEIQVFQFGGVAYDSYCELLSISDCFILFQEESLRELSRWPNVIGDFLAAGNPTVLLPVGDAKIAAEKYPFAFSRIDSFSQLDIQKVNELYKKTSNGNRKKIRRLAEDEFSWNKRGKSLEYFYKKIADRLTLNRNPNVEISEKESW